MSGCFVQSSLAQNGVHLKLGTVLVGDLSLASLSDTSMHQKGLHIGLDARVGPYGFYFAPGLHYYGVEIQENSGFNFVSKKPRFHIIKLPINIGYKIFITRKIKFRLEGGLSSNYMLLIDDNDQNLSYDTVNDLHFGANIGLELDFGRFTIGMNYESALTDALKTVEDSKMNYMSASMGFFF